MKTKLWFFSVVFIASLLLMACKEEVNAPSPVGKEQAIRKSASMTNGTVISADLYSDDKGKNHWEVKVDMPGAGGIVKFEFHYDSNNLRQISGLNESFNYEINPEMGLIKYSVAKSIALNASNGSVTGWKLEKDDSDNQWQYRFFIFNGSENIGVRINAVNGQVLKIK